MRLYELPDFRKSILPTLLRGRIAPRVALITNQLTIGLQRGLTEPHGNLHLEVWDEQHPFCRRQTDFGANLVVVYLDLANFDETFGLARELHATCRQCWIVTCSCVTSSQRHREYVDYALDHGLLAGLTHTMECGALKAFKQIADDIVQLTRPLADLVH